VQGIVQAVALAVLLVGATSAAMALRWPSVSLGTAVAAVALLASAAWQITRSVTVLDRAIGRIASQAAMVPLPARAGVARFSWRPATALQKGQAVMAIFLAMSVTVSGISLWRDFSSPRRAQAPLRSTPVAIVAPPPAATASMTAPAKAPRVGVATAPKRRVLKRTA
jgi:hypothetical protein